MKVLIADDDNGIRSLFKVFLRREFPDVSIDEAVDGVEAVNAFRNGHHDVLLMDINMPEKDGYHACLDIQKICEKNKLKLPFILFCTGFEISEEIEKLLADKTHYAVLKKPVSYDKLTNTIRALK